MQNGTKTQMKKAFTLIELLIVVAIIAILAAIAVPNFLEAQMRAKVSRAKSDLRNVATALEAYRVDNTQYPPTPFVSGGESGVMRVLPNTLSTPISYITSALIDPFANKLGDFQMYTRAGLKVTFGPDGAYPLDPGGDALAGRRYYYQSNRDRRRTSFAPDSAAAIAAREIEGDWITASYGPDEKRNLVTITGVTTYDILQPYDPTNGTISDGDIVRSQRQAEGKLTP